MRIDDRTSYLDLFSGTSRAEVPISRRAEPPPLVPPSVLPRDTTESRALVPLARPRPPADTLAEPEGANTETAPRALPAPETPFDAVAGNVNVRHLTPRQMSDVSLDLYVAGLISFDDYQDLAFQPELHPDYNRTVGALTGEPAAPDRPRDILKEWESRLDFQRRHDTADSPRIQRLERIVGVLARIGRPTHVLA